MWEGGGVPGTTYITQNHPQETLIILSAYHCGERCSKNPSSGTAHFDHQATKSLEDYHHIPALSRGPLFLIPPPGLILGPQKASPLRQLNFSLPLTAPPVQARRHRHSTDTHAVGTESREE